MRPALPCTVLSCPLGHQYNEKIDVFSFGIILYELLSGVVVASRVAMQGEHDELLDYARQVANGHREALPTHWPAQVRKVMMATLGHVALFSFCPMSVFAVLSRLCVCLTPAGDMLSCNCGDVCMHA